MRPAPCIAIAACLLVGCSSPTPVGSAGDSPSTGCDSALPTTSSPHEQTVNTVMSGTLPLVFDMTPRPARVCPGGTVVVDVKATNSGAEAITAFNQPLIMGCGGPPELVVGQIGPIDVPANGSVATTATFTVPAFAPGNCGFSVYGYGRSTDITVLAPTVPAP